VPVPVLLLEISTETTIVCLFVCVYMYVCMYVCMCLFRNQSPSCVRVFVYIMRMYVCMYVCVRNYDSSIDRVCMSIVRACAYICVYLCVLMSIRK
jgi:hypothetical protein